MSVERELFRQVMRRFATGVTVVTARRGDESHGMTVNAFTSVSLEPTLVLICADQRARTHRFIEESRAFAVNILADDQQSISQRFAQPWDGTDRFAGLDHRVGVTGAPLIDGCLGYLECRLVATHPAGDHSIFVGEVLVADLGVDGQPLLFHGGRYQRLAVPVPEP